MGKKKPTERQEEILAGLYLEREANDEKFNEISLEIDRLYELIRRLEINRKTVSFNQCQIEKEMKVLRVICGWGDR